jgi:anti-anti-sigma factor
VPEPSRTVRLVGFPVHLYARAAEHQAALQRELDVVRMSDDADETVPPPAVELLDEFDTRFRGYAATMAVITDLVGEGADEAEVVIPIVADPEEIAGQVRRLAELLDAADDYCRAAALMTVATPPELAALRRWLFGEVIAQLEGAAPTPWRSPGGAAAPEQDAPGPLPTVAHLPDGAPDGWSMGSAGGSTVLVATGALDLETAGALRGTLQGLRADSGERVVVDLTRIGFIDSVGLSVLVSAHVRFDQDGRRMRVRIPERLHRLFEISGLLGMLDIETVPSTYGPSTNGPSTAGPSD